MWVSGGPYTINSKHPVGFSFLIYLVYWKELYLIKNAVASTKISSKIEEITETETVNLI